MVQLFGSVKFKPKILVGLDALDFDGVECESLTPGSGAKSDYLGFGQIDTAIARRKVAMH